MKLKIYQEKSEEIEEEPVRLALRQEGEGILVHVVDENGNHIDASNLVKFYSNGIIHRCSSVNKKLGFQLDSFGKIKGC